MVRDRISKGKQMKELQTSHTHAHIHVHTQHATATTGKHNSALAQSTGGWYEVQWRATVSTWELVKQHNPNNNNKKGKLLEKKPNQKNHISFQAQSPHLRPSWMHMDLWSVWNLRDIVVTHMSHLGPVSHATPPKCEDLDSLFQGQGNYNHINSASDWQNTEWH